MFETAFFGSRGRRAINPKYTGTHNIVSAPSENIPGVFATVKPVAVLMHFFKPLIDPDNASVLDPTCGSGTALIAAEALGAKHVLGLEIDPGTAADARNKLLLARKTRMEKAWEEESAVSEETLNELTSKRAAE